MNIKVDTKFDIGQKVYICKRSSIFKDGIFVTKFIPCDDFFTITGIIISYNNCHFTIEYRVDMGINLYFEKYIFESKAEAIKWCEEYE